MSTNKNVDPNEIKKFEEMASRWWDLNGEFKPLHQINPLRLQYVKDNSQGLFGKDFRRWLCKVDTSRKHGKRRSDSHRFRHG